MNTKVENLIIDKENQIFQNTTVKKEGHNKNNDNGAITTLARSYYII